MPHFYLEEAYGRVDITSNICVSTPLTFECQVLSEMMHSYRWVLLSDIARRTQRFSVIRKGGDGTDNGKCTLSMLLAFISSFYVSYLVLF